MRVHTERTTFQTDGRNAMHDLTDAVAGAVAQSGCNSGTATIFVAHTTAAIIIGELEPGLVSDIQIPLEQLAPEAGRYRHNELNADDNAHSHLAGSIVGPSEIVPFETGRLLLGAWQRIILLELDTRSRRRTVVIQVQGE